LAAGLSGVAAASAVAGAHRGHLLAAEPRLALGWARAPDNILFWDIAKPGTALSRVEKSIYSAEYQRLCELLRQLRVEAGLTQVQVAAQLDVPQSFVSKYEAGERRLDVIELRHVAKVLGVSLRDFLDRLGE
jgi:DNA-binding transcriptional regulator YiaG